jgi:hypothetical protein
MAFVSVVASLVTRGARLLTPQSVRDQHILPSAFLIPAFAWMATVNGIARSWVTAPQQTRERLHRTR